MEERLFELTRILFIVTIPYNWVRFFNDLVDKMVDKMVDKLNKTELKYYMQLKKTLKCHKLK